MKRKIINMSLIASLIINMVLIYSLTDDGIEKNVEDTLNRQLFNAAFQIQEEMTDENYIKMEQIFNDIELLSRNTMGDSDYSAAIWQNVTIVNEMLTSELQHHILDVQPDKRKEISNMISDSVENDSIRELEQNMRDILKD